MKALIHNEDIRQPLVVELGEDGAGIPVFDAVGEAKAFLNAMPGLSSAWEVMELPDEALADTLEVLGVGPVDDEWAINWVILNAPPGAGQRGRPGVEAYLLGLQEYTRTLRTPNE